MDNYYVVYPDIILYKTHTWNVLDICEICGEKKFSSSPFCGLNMKTDKYVISFSTVLDKHEIKKDEMQKLRKLDRP